MAHFQGLLLLVFGEGLCFFRLAGPLKSTKPMKPCNRCQTYWPWPEKHSRSLIQGGLQGKQICLEQQKLVSFFLIDHFWRNHAILLMEEIPNNHRGCIKPCRYKGYLPYQLVQDFFPSTVCQQIKCFTSMVLLVSQQACLFLAGLFVSNLRTGEIVNLHQSFFGMIFFWPMIWGGVMRWELRVLGFFGLCGFGYTFPWI